MRAIWKGAVAFGLVNVPVRLFAATENKDVTFRQVHVTDGARVRMRRVCEADGAEVPYSEVAKGYETEDGDMVVLTDEDLAELPASSSREIKVEKFVPAAEIDPMLFEKSYYLQPDASAVKPYVLLREVLEDSDRMAIATVAIRNRTSLAVLRVRDESIVLQTMMWPDEIRDPIWQADAPADISEAERNMAKTLVETLAGEFSPEEYTDDWREAVEALVQAKISGGEVVRRPDQEDDGAEVVDLMAALEKSVAAVKAKSGENDKSHAG